MIELLTSQYTEPEYIDSMGLAYGERMRVDIEEWLRQQGIRYTMGFHTTEYAGQYLTIEFHDPKDFMLFKLRWR